MRLSSKQLDGIPGFDYIENLAGVTYNGPSLVYQNGLTHTTQILKNNGVYRVGFYFEWKYSSVARKFRYRIRADDSVTINDPVGMEPKDVENWGPPIHGFFYLVGENASVDLAIQFTNSFETDQAEVRNLKFEIWQVGVQTP